jgi:hypothetical protein
MTLAKHCILIPILGNTLFLQHQLSIAERCLLLTLHSSLLTTSGVPMTDTRPTYRITDLEVTERPRERLRRLGAQALSSAELIANCCAGRDRRKRRPGRSAPDQRLSPCPGYTRLFDEVRPARHREAKTAQTKQPSAGPPPWRLKLRRPGGAQPGDAADLVRYETALERSCAFPLDNRNRAGDETVYRARQLVGWGWELQSRHPA